jgi:LPXTG-site transpeptidase (sortase) family protein
MKKLLIEALIGILLIAGGLILWNLRLDNEITDAQPASPSTNQPAKAPVKATIEGEPNSLSIPSMGMSWTIIPGYYNSSTKQWTLTLSEVQYATITPPPNNASGNTFLYGHYRPEVFARLHLIQIGTQAVVTTTNGHSFTYQLAKIEVVSPSDDSLFLYQGPPILTIQTCTGLFFQNRQLFVFNLISVT